MPHGQGACRYHKKNLMHAPGPIPAGSRLLRSEANKGNPAKFLCVFGIYRSMSQFVDSARLLGTLLMTCEICQTE